MILLLLSHLFYTKRFRYPCKGYPDYLNYDGPIELDVECPQDIPIKLNTPVNCYDLVIAGSTNVYLTCLQSDNESDKYTLTIYGEPTIKFKRSCRFSELEIFSFPNLTKEQDAIISVDSLRIHHDNYIYPFDRITPGNNSKRLFVCNKRLDFNLSNSIQIVCDFQKYDVDYINISKKKFYFGAGTVDIINHNSNKTAVSHVIKEIVRIVHFTENKNIKLSNFYDLDEIDEYIQLFPKNNYEFWLDAKPYIPFDCQKVSVFDTYEYKEAIEQGWGLMCNNNTGYLHYYHTDDEMQFNILPKAVLALFIFIVIILFVTLLISIYFIFQWKMKKAVDRQSTADVEIPKNATLF